ncbi:MAG: hypothetical protein ACYCZK_00015 [Microbacteriaceae bacterium]
MTGNLAYALPAESPGEDRRRHIEIVTTRSQRRARPRLVYAVVTALGLFAILMAQLLLSIVVSQGAYTISSLQLTQKGLTRSEQALSDQLAVLNSPQNLASQAEALGMVGNASPAFLKLSDGTVLGSATAAPATATTTAPGGSPTGAAVGNLIPNSLLPNLPAAAAGAGAATAAATPATSGTVSRGAVPPAGTVPATGASAPGQASGSIPSTGALPAPVTR